MESQEKRLFLFAKKNKKRLYSEVLESDEKGNIKTKKHQKVEIFRTFKISDCFQAQKLRQVLHYPINIEFCYTFIERDFFETSTI